MSTPPVVLVTHEADPATRAAYIDVLEGLAHVCFWSDVPAALQSAVLREASIVSGLFPDRELSAAQRSQLQRLRLLQLITAGSNHVDLALWPHGIPMGTSPGAQSEEIAEHALALILAGAKNIIDQHRKLTVAQFAQFEENRRLAGSTCTIIGLGGIGKATARLCRAFGMRVQAFNRTGTTDEPVEFIGTLASLDRALPASDFVVLCVELNSQTRNLLDARKLALMKDDAVLVNVARAHLVEERALYEHLVSHPRFVACLDAWWKEPSTHGAFSTDFPLLQLPNVIGSPHNASRLPGITAKMSRQAATNIRRFLAESGDALRAP